MEIKKTISGVLMAILPFVSCLSSYAQENQSSVFKLSDCLNYALQSSYEVKKSFYDIKDAEARLKESKGGLLPQISASGSITDNIVIPKTMMPGEMFDQPGTYVPMEFGIAYSSKAGIDLEQVVFDASLFTGVKISRNAKELSELRMTMTHEEMIYNVSNTFYDIVYSENLLKNNIETIAIMDSIYRKTEIQVAQNVTREIDLNRMKVTLSNAMIEKEKTTANISQQHNYLKVLIGMPLENDLKLDVNNTFNQMEYNNADNFSDNISNKIDLKILNNERTSYELEMRQHKMSYLPTLSVFVSSGYQLESEKLRFNDHWFNSTSVGIKLAIPIFDGGVKQNRIRQSGYKISKVEEEIKRTEQTMLSDCQNARLQLQVSWKTVSAQQENMEVAEKNYQQSIMLYQEGLYSITDLLDTEKTFREAQNSYLYERVNYRKNLLNLLKAEGTLTTILNQ